MVSLQHRDVIMIWQNIETSSILHLNLRAFYLRIRWVHWLDIRYFGLLEWLQFFRFYWYETLNGAWKPFSFHIKFLDLSDYAWKIELFENQIGKSLEFDNEKRVGTLSFGNSDNIMPYSRFSTFSWGQMSQVDQNRAAELKLKIVCEKCL